MLAGLFGVFVGIKLHIRKSPRKANLAIPCQLHILEFAKSAEYLFQVLLRYIARKLVDMQYIWLWGGASLFASGERLLGD